MRRLNTCFLRSHADICQGHAVIGNSQLMPAGLLSAGKTDTGADSSCGVAHTLKQRDEETSVLRCKQQGHSQQAEKVGSGVEHSRPPEANIGDDRIGTRSGPVQVLYGGVLEVCDLT